MRRLLIAPTSRVQFWNKSLVKRNGLKIYRRFMERLVLKGLLPVESFIVKWGNESYCTKLNDNRTFKIVYGVNDDDLSKYDIFESLDILMGLLIHECGHAIYSIYDESISKKLEELSDTYKVPLSTVRYISNTFEDVFIQNRLSMDIPGTGGYLVYMNTALLGDDIRKKLEKAEELTFVSLLYLSFIDEDLTKEYLSKLNPKGYTWDDLNQFRMIPKSTQESIEFTEKVLRFTQSNADDIEDDHESSKEDSTSKGGESSGDKNSSDLTNSDGTRSDMGESELDDIIKKILDKLGNIEHKPSPRSPKSECKNSSSYRIVPDAPKTDDESQQIKLDSDTTSNIPEYDEDPTLHSWSEGGVAQTVTWLSISETDQSRYDDKVSKVAGSAAVLRTYFEKYNQGGWKVNSLQKIGKIDRRFLPRVRMDDDRVFKTLDKRINQPLDVILLIDESGSMSGNKCEKAAEVAILVHEALLRIPNINYWCYGHTTSYDCTEDHPWDSVIMRIYHEGIVTDFDEKYKIGKISAFNGNCDGRAILEAANRVKSRIKPDRKVLMILISDGQPTETCDPNIDAREYAKTAAQIVESYGYQFIHVGIQCSNHTLYKNSIDYVDANQITQVIGTLISEHIKSNRGK